MFHHSHMLGTQNKLMDLIQILFQISIRYGSVDCLHNRHHHGGCSILRFLLTECCGSTIIKSGSGSRLFDESRSRIQIQVQLFLGLHEGFQSIEEASSFQNMNFLNVFLFFGSFLPAWIQFRILIPKLDPDPLTQLSIRSILPPYKTLLLEVNDICVCLGICGVFGGEPEPGGAAGPGSPLHTDGALQLHSKVCSFNQKHKFFLKRQRNIAVFATRKNRAKTRFYRCIY
jgi:hypothetical protein